MLIPKWRKPMAKACTTAVLVHQGLGDCIMTMPLLRHCEAKLQRTDRLILVARAPFVVEFLKGLTWRSNVEIWHPTGLGARRKLWGLRLLWDLRKVKVDLLLAPLLADKLTNAIWLALTGAKLAITPKGYWLGRFSRSRVVDMPSRIHKTDEIVEFGHMAGFGRPLRGNLAMDISFLQPNKMQSKFPWWRSNLRWIVLAPGSDVGAAHKRYPAAEFRDVARLLLDSSPDIGVVVIGSQKERDLVRSISEGSGIDARRCIGLHGLALGDCLLLLKHADCLVSACSGASHLGALAGTPIVGLFGPTNPGRTGAYTQKLRVVRVGLKCSPCYRDDAGSGCGDPICMSMIKPETVVQAVFECLRGEAYPPTPWCETTNAVSPSYPAGFRR
jgi:heptosyltransferase II